MRITCEIGVATRNPPCKQPQGNLSENTEDRASNESHAAGGTAQGRGLTERCVASGEALDPLPLPLLPAESGSMTSGGADDLADSLPLSVAAAAMDAAMADGESIPVQTR